MSTAKPFRSMAAWLWHTWPVLTILVHLFIPACAVAMLADPPDWPWNLVAWLVIGMVLPIFWLGFWRYWRWLKRVQGW